MSMLLNKLEIILHGDATLAYFALHNQADGQGDRGIIVQHRLVVHSVHCVIADLVASIGDLLDVRGGEGRGGGQGGQGRG
jgi:hypothetical protein